MKEGIIFIIIWIVVLVLWGASKNIKPDLSKDVVDDPCYINGHPLWNDC